MAKETTRRSNNILLMLEKAVPGRNVVYTAVSNLKSQIDIVRFHDAYVKFLRKHGTSVKIRRNPEDVALRNIQAVMMEYSGGMQKIGPAGPWEQAVHDIQTTSERQKTLIASLRKETTKS